MSMMKAALAIKEKMLAEACDRSIERVFTTTALAIRPNTDQAAVHLGARMALHCRMTEAMQDQSSVSLVLELLGVCVPHGWIVPRDSVDSVRISAIVATLESRQNTDDWLDEYIQTHEHAASDPATSNREYFTAWTAEVLRLEDEGVSRE